VFIATASAAFAQGGNPLAKPVQGTAPFAGVFENEQMRVELKNQDGRYSGTIRYGGQEFPATARGEGNKLTGSFQADGQSFEFTARLEDDTLTLETGGATHILRKQAPANPLARSSTGAAPGSSIESSPQQIHKNSLGISFQVPEGWTVTENQGGSSLLPPGAPTDTAQGSGESYTISGSADYDDPEDPELLREMMTTLQTVGVQSARRTNTEGFRTPEGEGVIYTVDGTNAKLGKPVRVRVYIAPTGDAVLFLIALGDAALVDGRDKTLRQVAETLRYDASTAQQAGGYAQQANQGYPQGAQGMGGQGMAPQGGLSDGHPQSQQWLQVIGGKLLTQLSSYSSGGGTGGYSSRKRLYLAPNGSFQYAESGSVSVDVGGAFGNTAGGDSATGRWRVVTQGGASFLILNLQSGEVWQLRLDYQDGKTFVDGVRTYVTNPDGS